MYDLSQGIIDIAVKLYMLAQWQAIEDEDGSERITSALLDEVARQHMQIVQPMLKVLRRNDPDAQILIDDLYPKWDVLDQYLQRSSEKVNIQGQVRTKVLREEKVEQDEEKLIELVTTAFDFGVSSDLAYEAANKVLQSNETEKSMVNLRKQLVKEISFNSMAGEEENHCIDGKKTQEKENNKAQKKKKKQVMLDDDDLRKAAAGNAKDTEAIYEKLVDIGSIPSEDELSKLII
jgi:hypothetical protein